MFSRAAFDALTSDGITRAWTGLGGSHTFVTYPPLDALRSVSPDSVLANMVDIPLVGLYVHLPFCEMTCPFCPYETHVISDSTSSLDIYLRALTDEMKMIGKNLRNAEVQSLYIGGGTATVLSEIQLETLFAHLRDHFAFSADALICVETSPNALIRNPEKIGLLKHLGAKRVSVGVQTFSERALRSEGRTHSPDETLEILQTLLHEIDVVNIDLMQDMPGQTDEDLDNDIDRIATLRPAQVTWYVERLRQRNGRFPDSYCSVNRRLRLRDRMKELSYRPRPGGRFVRSGCGDDAFKHIRCGLNSHLVGLGASAYGHVPGCFYRNTVDTSAYINTALGGNVPIATGAQLRKLDTFAAALTSGIRWGAGLAQSDPDLERYVCEAKRRLETLIRHQLVCFDPTMEKYQITLDGPGWAYEEEICSLFVPEDVVDQIRAKNLAWWFSRHQ
ncbi:MAG TPA: radical SAM protein [Terriglobia bacterium]|nr:radical SAM protein [Terriglobia bacterium]